MFIIPNTNCDTKVWEIAIHLNLKSYILEKKPVKCQHLQGVPWYVLLFQNNVAGFFFWGGGSKQNIYKVNAYRIS